MKKNGNGKVRDLYEVDENSIMLVVSDRISAFDNIMPQEIRDKGIILNQISEFWFDYVSDIVPNHIITDKFEEFPKMFQKEEFRGRSMWVKKLKMLPVECVVRGYITGSAWKDYNNTGEISGIKIPKGMKESEKFKEALFSPAAKAEIGEHDENISFEKAVELLGLELAEKVKTTSLAIYNKCAKYALTRGIILADTKFEFGLDENGELVLADEVLTPDSSRFWSLSRYEVGREQESFDKQYLRNWLKANGYVNKAPDELPQEVLDITKEKYLECYEKITGRKMAY
ncbi:MAG: phosphoribosylaminoimidazolesuccinocarboxamide synthase [Clostridiales bacterium]|nr:phosphoribosylaminoimidazolesuccinocarboxamide synthase [Clostridiales bacterium]